MACSTILDPTAQVAKGHSLWPWFTVIRFGPSLRIFLMKRYNVIKLRVQIPTYSRLWYCNVNLLIRSSVMDSTGDGLGPVFPRGKKLDQNPVLPRSQFQSTSNFPVILDSIIPKHNGEGYYYLTWKISLGQVIWFAYQDVIYMTGDFE